MGPRHVLVDIGNRRLKVLSDVALESAPDRTWHPPIANWDPEQPRTWSRIDTEHPIDWWISSVQQATTSRLVQWIEHIAPSDRIHLLTSRSFPLDVELESPDRVGIDRLSAACGALALAEPPLIVVDAGTAITVDLVLPPKRFMGGAILPSMSLMAESLARGTDALPKIDSFPPDVEPPGRDTLQALQIGITSAAIGGVERIVRTYRGDRDPRRFPVLITGGDGSRLCHAIPNAVWDGHLVLRGTHEAARIACRLGP